MSQKPQVKPTNIEFSCTEIGGLWGVYFQESLTVRFLTYLMQHLQDGQIVPLAEEALNISNKRLDKIKGFFTAENFPIPEAFSDGDVNLSAPQLFRDTFTLSFLYMMNRLGMINFAFVATNNVRLDVLDFFNECLHTSTDMFGKAVRMMLEKGIYDRPPMMNYPRKIEYVEETSFLDGIFGEKRPLSAIELSEIFFNIERNYFSVILMLGFAQVMRNKKLRDLIIRGKKISEQQIELFNDLLTREDLLGTVPVTMLVTDSTVSPFSDKLIMSMINVLNSVDILLISHALALSMRVDLAAHYTKIIAKVMSYGKDVFDMMVKEKWLEQPPLTTNRKKLLE